MAESAAGTRSRLVTTCSAAGSSRPDAAAVKRLQTNGVPVRLFRRLRVSSAAAWGLSPRMLVWLISGIRSTDVVHLQYVWCATTLWCCFLASVFRVPVVLTPHESLTAYDIEVASGSRLKSAFKKLLRKPLLRTVDVLVLMSELERRDTDPGPTRAILIRHATVEARIQPRQERQPQEPGRLRIAFLGRNVPKKGIERLIRSLTDTRATGWQLSIAGPPGAEEAVESQMNLARELAVHDRVKWLGFVDSREKLFDESDVLAMPSDYEGFGMVAAEAMAAGLPVIVPSESGAAELVSEFDAGCLIRHATEPSLADALAEFDSRRADWFRFGHNGIRAANERLSFEQYSAMTERLYDSLLGTSERTLDADMAAIESTSAAGRYR